MTENKQQFVQRERCAQVFDQTKVNELKKTHYMLGSDKNTYVSEMQQNYIPIDVEKVKREEQFQLKTDNEQVYL